MNEQIQQLADKIWAEEYWGNPNTDKLLPAQLNKFAELIVKECIGVVQKGGGMCGAISSDTLKRHFYGVDFYGVEE